MKKELIVKQSNIKDCGICCLESIIKYYGGYIPLEKLREETKTNKDGTSAYNLIKVAKKIGFNAIGKRVEDLDMEKLTLPAIAHIVTPQGLSHFVVIYKINKNKIFIMDPACGFKKENITEFQKQWTKVLLFFKPYQKIPFYNLKNSGLEIIKKISKSEKKLIIQILKWNFLITILALITSYFFEISLTNNEKHSSTSYLVIVLIFLYLNIIKVYANYLKNTLSIYLSKNIDLKVIPDFISYVFHLPLHVITTRTSGEILTRVQELNEVKNLYEQIIIVFILDLSLVLSSSIFLYALNNYLFLILLVIAIILGLTGIFSSPIISRKIKDNMEYQTTFNSNLVENLDGIITIKNHNLINNSINEITDNYCNFVESTMKNSQYLNKIQGIKTFLVELSFFIINALGLYWINLGKIKLVTLITFTSLMNNFINPLEEMINMLPGYLKIKNTLTKINEFCYNEPEPTKGLKYQYGDIKIENLSYSYDDCQEIFHGLNLTFRKNTHVELKGVSGSGKSTICKLLNRTIDDYQGTIKINNLSIKSFSLNSLRENIVYVSQEEKIFSKTIIENILNNHHLPVKELSKILTITEVNEILDKKSFALDSYLYDGGYNLSGGERQRIILARALVTKPHVLILDESLSEVEPEMEQSIVKKLRQYLQNSTIIYISHRNSKCFENQIWLGEKVSC